MPRVAVIGLDAAERWLVEHLMADGAMPNLARIRRRSAECRLRSESTWRSGRVWETFLTGVADFPSAAEFDPATYQTAQLGARRKRPFYARVPGLRVVALDVPYMTLWYDAPGAQVTAWGGHDAGYPRASSPAGLLREIDAKFGTHPAFLNDFTCGWHHAPSMEALFQALVTGARRRVEVAHWLQERFPDWDLFMTVLSEAHSAGEFFWHGVEGPLAGAPTAALARARLVEVHRVLDEALGRLVASLPEDTALVVCSVHGMRPNHADLPSMVLLPELLHRLHFGRGLLGDPDQRRWRGAGCPPLSPRDDQKWDDYMVERRARSAAGRLRRDLELALPPLARAARALHRRIRGEPAPPPLEAFAEEIPVETRLDPAEIGEPRAPLHWQVPCWYRRYWRSMRAFALPVFYDGRLRLNLRGRERHGRVAAADYEATCDEFEGLLRACRDARSGRSVVAQVERPRAADPLDPEGPDADLVVTWNDGVDAFQHPELGTVGPFPFRRTGGHTDHGFAYLSGPGVGPGDLGERDALDLTPTVLALLGRETPEGLSGTPIAAPGADASALGVR